MCGIAGIVDLAGRSVEPEVLDRACETMRHRGPDDSGTWYDTQSSMCVGLAATRLAVIDPTPGGRQPMVWGDGRFVIVFNGLIYNYRELREALIADGATLATQSDTEVALAACAKWGPAAFERFNGMWALAFYDRRERSGFISRDRFGIKPLFWVAHNQRFCFASEMRTLAAMGDWPADLNPAAVVHYVRYGYVAHPDTIYAAVRRLGPATYMPFDASGIGEPVRYYDVPVRSTGAAVVDPAEARRQVRRALFQSVARRRVADVPIGAFLSGGLDSSIVVAHLAEVTSGPVKTFSVGYAEHAAYDETRFARSVAQRFGTEHYELKVSYDDVIDLLPRMLDHLGEPFFDSSILPTAIVAEFARRHVTVSLSGDGGDELFGGYWRYVAQGWCERYYRLPRRMRSWLIEPIMRTVAVSKSSGLGNRVRQFRKLLRAGGGDALARHIAWSRILAPEARDVLRFPDDEGPSPTPGKGGVPGLRCVDGDDAMFDRLLTDTSDCDPADPLNRILAFDLQYGLPSDMLHKVDLASMYHSLEVRVPFLDPDVVAVATSLPSSMKVGSFGGKTILKEAYAGILPGEILHRSKQGFEVPIGEFLRGRLREMFLDTVTRPVIESFGMLDYDAVQRVYADHCARRGEHADLLFALLSLCWWRRGD